MIDSRNAKESSHSAIPFCPGVAARKPPINAITHSLIYSALRAQLAFHALIEVFCLFAGLKRIASCALMLTIIIESCTELQAEIL
jgi:hypothetical protein